MIAEPKIKYFGWSSFMIESSDGNLLFDPFFRKMYGAKYSDPKDFAGTKVICLTHGHFDHYIDSVKLLKSGDAVVVSSKMVCDHLHSRYKITRERLIPLQPYGQTQQGDFKITAFEWRHRVVNFMRIVRADWIRGLHFAWINLLQVPFHSPYYGFFVEMPTGVAIMNYCEGFSNAMDVGEVRELGRRMKPDLLLAGIQLDFEEYVAKGVEALAPKTVVLFHPHEAFFEKVGLKSKPPQVFIDKIRERTPNVEIILASIQSYV